MRDFRLNIYATSKSQDKAEEGNGSMARPSQGPPHRRTEPGQIRTELDRIDLKMLEVLRQDGRISIAALAQRVGISRANAYMRFEALRSGGVASCPSALLSAKAQA